MGRCQFLHPTGGGMEANLQFVEGKTATNIDDKFAVEDKFLRGQARERDDDVREIAGERLARFRLQINVFPAANLSSMLVAVFPSTNCNFASIPPPVGCKNWQRPILQPSLFLICSKAMLANRCSKFRYANGELRWRSSRRKI